MKRSNEISMQLLTSPTIISNTPATDSSLDPPRFLYPHFNRDIPPPHDGLAKHKTNPFPFIDFARGGKSTGSTPPFILPFKCSDQSDIKRIIHYVNTTLKGNRLPSSGYRATFDLIITFLPSASLRFADPLSKAFVVPL